MPTTLVFILLVLLVCFPIRRSKRWYRHEIVGETSPSQGFLFSTQSLLFKLPPFAACAPTTAHVLSSYHIPRRNITALRQTAISYTTKEVYIVMDGECSDGAMSSSPTVSGSGASAGCPGSPLSPLPSTSPTGKRRSAKKRVVTVPLADVSGPRPKGVGEGNTPTDSWAWRKYGQKPIKGSPYPRAYYRCSSSKGCPARKQVERNRADPAMVIVTYSSEHNHSGLVARAQSRQNQKSKAQPSPPEMAEPEDKPAAWAAPPAACAAPPAEDPAIEVHDDFRWLYDVVSVTSTSPSDETDEMMYGPMFLGTVDTALLLPDELGDVGGEGSEEDALFEGLGELPECAMVFQRRAGGGLAGEVKVGQPPEGTAMT